MIKQLVEHIVKNLVQEPDVVQVVELDASGKKIVQVHVAAADLARVIGSEGRVFRALRATTMLLGGEQCKDIVVEIAQ